ALRPLRRRAEPLLPPGEPAPHPRLAREAPPGLPLAPRDPRVRAPGRVHGEGRAPRRPPADGRGAGQTQLRSSAMLIPKRIQRQAGRYSLVDGVPFQLPVASQKSPALMAAFPVDADRAQELLPGNELHVLRWGLRAVLLVAV